MKPLEEEVPADGQTQEDQEGHRQEAEFFEALHCSLREARLRITSSAPSPSGSSTAPTSGWAAQ